MGAWSPRLAEARKGVLLHYDASGSDAGAVAWMNDPRCKVSYNWLVLDNGDVVIVAPVDARAYHAGVCRPSDPKLAYKWANSAFYGIAIAATDGERATEAQRDAVSRISAGLFIRHRWSRSAELWRISGHHLEAWPRGRKHDPVGSNPEKPVLSVDEIRTLVRLP